MKARSQKFRALRDLLFPQEQKATRPDRVDGAPDLEGDPELKLPPTNPHRAPVLVPVKEQVSMGNVPFESVVFSFADVPGMGEVSDGLTPEEASERAKKGWETRHAKGEVAKEEEPATPRLSADEGTEKLRGLPVGTKMTIRGNSPMRDGTWTRTEGGLWKGPKGQALTNSDMFDEKSPVMSKSILGAHAKLGGAPVSKEAAPAGASAAAPKGPVSVKADPAAKEPGQPTAGKPEADAKDARKPAMDRRHERGRDVHKGDVELLGAVHKSPEFKASVDRIQKMTEGQKPAVDAIKKATREMYGRNNGKLNAENIKEIAAKAAPGAEKLAEDLMSEHQNYLKQYADADGNVTLYRGITLFNEGTGTPSRESMRWQDKRGVSSYSLSRSVAEQFGRSVNPKKVTGYTIAVKVPLKDVVAFMPLMTRGLKSRGVNDKTYEAEMEVLVTPRDIHRQSAEVFETATGKQVDPETRKKKNFEDEAEVEMSSIEKLVAMLAYEGTSAKDRQYGEDEDPVATFASVPAADQPFYFEAMVEAAATDPAMARAVRIILSSHDEAAETPLTDEQKARIVGYIKTHPGLDDSDFHAFVESIGIDPHEAEEAVYAELQRRLDFEGNSEGAKKGWETRQRGGKVEEERVESVSESMQKAGETTHARSEDYRKATAKLPDGTVINGWKKITTGGDPFWQKGKRTETRVLEEAGNKHVDKALKDAGITVGEAKAAGTGVTQDEILKHEPTESADEPKPGQPRAKVGGEVAPNSEFYKGGQFIATTDLPKKLKEKFEKSATGRENFEVGFGSDKWAVPEPGKVPIVGRLVGTYLDKDGSINEQFVQYQKLDENTVSQLKKASEAFKRGERWMDANEIPSLINHSDMARIIKAKMPVTDEMIGRMPPDVAAELRRAATHYGPKYEPAAPKPEASEDHSKLSAQEMNDKGYIPIYRGTDANGFHGIKATEGGVYGKGVDFYLDPSPSRSHATSGGGVITGFAKPEDIEIHGGVAHLKDPGKFIMRGKIPVEETLEGGDAWKKKAEASLNPSSNLSTETPKLSTAADAIAHFTKTDKPIQLEHEDGQTAGFVSPVSKGGFQFTIFDKAGLKPTIRKPKVEEVVEEAIKRGYTRPTETRVNELGEAAGLGRIVNPKYQLRHSLGVKNFSDMLAFADMTEEIANPRSRLKLARVMKEVFHA